MAKKVIIIDDSSSSLNFLKTAFAKSSWEVHGAQNATLGYQMIFDCAPDLIITDALMPLVGGFQFIKKIRENEQISKIPVIVYSVLDAKNAKFYIKEQNAEYFLQKDDNVDELLKLAQEVIEKHPLEEEYKSEIIIHENENFLSSLNENKEESEIKEEIEEEQKKEILTRQTKEKEEEIKLDEDKLQLAFKENYDFTYSDEKVFSKIFSIISPLLKYDLFLINVFSYEKNKDCVFFDVKDIILSPIFQNQALNKYNAEEIVLFKKYTPNLKMIINEEEFFSKIEFSFEYNSKNIGNIAYYSREKNKWQDEDNLRTMKNVLYSFFKARYVNKSATNNKKDEIINKYFINKIDLIKNTKFDNETKKESYIGILNVTNFSELSSDMSESDLDILNSKVSEKIMNVLNPSEQISKNDKDEYTIIIYTKDEKEALNKFNCILNTINNISHENNRPKAIIGASKCTIDGSFNIYEAQKLARNALEYTSENEKTVIK